MYVRGWFFVGQIK